jgi:SAM-dependent methyltransferase
LAICRSCGTAWQCPPPSAELVARAYEDLRDDVYVAEARSRRMAFRLAARLLRRYAGRPEGRLLDVGCSAGLFLDVARDAGWEVWGVEPSTWLSGIAAARFGDHIVNATLEASPFEPSHFSAITMWDVLEHVPAPRPFLERARGLLASGGILAINVPARDSLIARMFGQRWPLLLPEHLVYFTRRSLRTLLEATGFEVLGFHLHPVFFSLDYVLRRLAQHGVAANLAIASLGRLTVPLLMGEVTVFARAR